MNAKAILSILVLGFISSAFGQKQTLDLTFTAVDNTVNVRLDSVKVMNRTQGSETVLYWPDTTIVYEITPGDLLLYVGYAMGYPVGVHSISDRSAQFQLSQIYPNPVRDEAEMSISLPSNGSVNIAVTDIRGRVVLYYEREFQAGTHSFIFHPGDDRIYILTACWHGITQGIKVLTKGPTTGKACRLEYTGIEKEDAALKQSQFATELVVQESGVLDSPMTNETYTFQFATNIPCPGTPSATYEGQVYNTIQIFSQCWLKENLNVGTMIPGTQDMSNNGVIEKYCYNNEEDSCTKYGGLYLWNEMMQYTTQQGVQGICPLGWHLPTDEEWKVLEGAVDSQYGIGDNTWNEYGWRGNDAGANLKATSNWNGNDNGTDLFGFTGLPGGEILNVGFMDIGSLGYWMTSSGDGNYYAWYRRLDYYSLKIVRDDAGEDNGFSVRCLRDY